MSLITCCPSCGTKFRVVADQLRISEGWVRCGRCQEVFDAQQAMVTDAPAVAAASAANTPGTSGAVAVRASAPAVASPPVVSAAPLSPQRAAAPAVPAEAVHSGYELPVPPDDDEDVVWEVPVAAATPAAATESSAVPRRPVPPVWEEASDLDPAEALAPAAVPNAPPAAHSVSWMAATAAPPASAPEVAAVPEGSPAVPAPPAAMATVQEVRAALEFPEVPVVSRAAMQGQREPQWDLPAPPSAPVAPVAEVPPVWGDAARRVAAAAVAAGRVPEMPRPRVVSAALQAEALSQQAVASPITASAAHAVDAFLDAPPVPPEPEPEVARVQPAVTPAADGAVAPAAPPEPDEAHLAHEEAVAEQPLAAAPLPEQALPGFVKQAQRKAWWNQPWVRFVMGMLVMLLPLALALQVAIHERNALVAWQPQWRGALESMCVALRCELAPHRDIRAVVVSDSSFAAAAEPHHYRLELGVRNRSGAAVAMPAVELVLTDAQEQVLVRKVLQPSEIGAPQELAAHAEWTVTLPIATQGLNLQVFGYRVTVFYP